MVTQFGGQDAVGQVAKQFGLDEQTTQAAVGALLPAIASGLKANASKQGGTQALFDALAGGGHAKYLEDPAQLASDGATSEGNGILGHVLGNKDASRAVAASVAQAVGVENETVKKMLPIAAAMAMSGLAKKSQGQPRFGAEDLTNLLRLL